MKEILIPDEDTTRDLLTMLQWWRRTNPSFNSIPYTPEADFPASGVFVCVGPEGGIAAYTGVGTIPSAECEVRRLTTPLPPLTTIDLEQIPLPPDDDPFTERVYNVLDAAIEKDQVFLAVNTRHGHLVVVGGGGGSSSGGPGGCACECIDSGDIVVNGLETTSRWTVKMKTETFRGTFGDIIFPAGDYVVLYDAGLGKWVLDIGDVLTAVYLDGTSATSATTMDGTLEMQWDLYGEVSVTLCVDGTVPEPPE